VNAFGARGPRAQISKMRTIMSVGAILFALLVATAPAVARNRASKSKGSRRSATVPTKVTEAVKSSAVAMGEYPESKAPLAVNAPTPQKASATADKKDIRLDALQPENNYVVTIAASALRGGLGTVRASGATPLNKLPSDPATTVRVALYHTSF
jgi:hypothetical protein